MQIISSPHTEAVPTAVSGRLLRLVTSAAAGLESLPTAKSAALPLAREFSHLLENLFDGLWLAENMSDEPNVT